METNMDMTTSTIETSNLLEAWQIVAAITTKFQNNVSETPSVGDLLDSITITSTEQNAQFLNELSIIHQQYGKSKRICKVEAGRRLPKGQNSKLELENNQHVIDVIDAQDKKITYFDSKKNCADNGFEGYSSVLIVPMRLDKKKNIGAFIFHSLSEGNYDHHKLQEIYDVFSDRAAFYIRNAIRRKRNRIFEEVRNELLEDELKGVYKTECQLLAAVVKKLRAWYGEEKINILIADPMDQYRYFLACDDNKVRKNFRKYGLMEEAEVQALCGGDEVLTELEKKNGLAKGLTKISEAGINRKNRKDEADCQAWLGAAMHVGPDDRIGFFILHNTKVSQAYEHGEDNFLNNIAKFTAQLLVDFRLKRANDLIERLDRHGGDKAYIENLYEITLEEELHNDEEMLFPSVYEALKNTYGIQEAAFLLVDRLDMKLKVKFEKLIASSLDSESFLVRVQNHMEGLRSIPNSGFGTKEFILKDAKQKYLLAPMRTGNTEKDWRVIGCVLIPIGHISKSVVKDLDRITDKLAERCIVYLRKERQNKLDSFLKKVGQMQVDSLSGEHHILEIARNAIKDIMNSDNLYIALYDQVSNEIRFPVIYRKAKIWEEMHNKTRILDRTQLGKTEYIILNDEILLHQTEHESDQWFKQQGHKEWAGDPLISWVGVPIYAPVDSNQEGDRGIQGVIAAYHAEKEYVYSTGDVGILNKIASGVCGLMKLLKEKDAKDKLEEAIANNTTLNEVNSKLKDAQTTIAEQQHQISTSLLAQDLKHRVNNVIGGAILDIQFAEKELQNIIADCPNSKQEIDYSADMLQHTQEDLKNLLESVEEITNDAPIDLSLHSVIDRILNNTKNARKLSQKGIQVLFKSEKKRFHITTRYRTLSNSLSAIIENAADSLLENIQLNGKVGLFLEILLKEKKGFYHIEIIDNGVIIPEKNKNRIFEHGFSTKESSGFGLWRARTTIESLGGTLSLSQQNHKDGSRKTFNISLPKLVNVTDKSQKDTKPIQPKLAWVLDDERSWRTHISSWLKELGYEVTSFANEKDLSDAIGNSDYCPQVVTLDISLNEDGGSTSGLTLINTFKKLNSVCKVIVITGYSSKAHAYGEEYDALLEKFGESVLNIDIFRKLIEKMNEKQT